MPFDILVPVTSSRIVPRRIAGGHAVSGNNPMTLVRRQEGIALSMSMQGQGLRLR